MAGVSAMRIQLKQHSSVSRSHLPSNCSSRGLSGLVRSMLDGSSGLNGLVRAGSNVSSGLGGLVTPAVSDVSHIDGSMKQCE